ncbi:MAG: hypothetical protein ABH826_00955 [Patescibacteria group bacterium]
MKDFVSQPTLPRGVRKDWRGRLRFTITTTAGLYVPIVLSTRKSKDADLPKIMKIDSNKVLFDQQGKIVRVELGTRAHLPQAIQFKRLFYRIPEDSESDGIHMSLFVYSPTNMGIHDYFYGDFKIGKDGLLMNVPGHNTLWRYKDNQNLFVNLFKSAIEATSPLRN